MSVNAGPGAGRLSNSCADAQVCFKQYAPAAMLHQAPRGGLHREKKNRRGGVLVCAQRGATRFQPGDVGGLIHVAGRGAIANAWMYARDHRGGELSELVVDVLMTERANPPTHRAPLPYPAQRRVPRKKSTIRFGERANAIFNGKTGDFMRFAVVIGLTTSARPCRRSSSRSRPG